MASLSPMPVAERPEDKFAEFLAMRGHRQTKERHELVRHIFQYHDHFTAEDLLLEVKQKKMVVSRPTIYRTLNLLVEAGLLRKLRFGDRDAYEHDYGYPEHDHLYCTKCNKIIEFHNEELIDLRERVCREQNFRAESHRLVISGLCDECLQAGGKKR